MPIKNPSGTIGLVVVSAVALTSAGCTRPTSAKDGPPASSAAHAVTKVEVVRPSRETLRRVVEQPGQIEPCEVTPIHAKLSGYARNVAVDIGDHVKKGQVITEIWDPEIEADLRQKRASVEQAESRRVQAGAEVEVAQAGLHSAEAKLTEAQAGIKKFEAELARWQSEYARTERLVNERAVTGSVLDETRSNLRAAESARDAIHATVKSAEAALAEARARLDRVRSDVVAAVAGIDVARAEAHRAEALLGYARIEAPYDGVVTRRHVDTGHLTIAGPQGDPLFVIAKTDVVTFVVGVPEVFAAAVEPGDRARLRLQALGGRTIDGRVSRTAYVLDAATRTLRVEIDVPNADGTLRPGLYVNATIIVEEHPDVLTIPETALVRDGDVVSCIVIANGRVERRPLVVGLSDGTRTEVTSGLREDESVVKVNTGSLRPGQPVEPVSSPNAKP